MRKIEEEMVRAIARGSNLHKGNTSVEVDDGVPGMCTVRLHGNMIASVPIGFGNSMQFTLAGWNTPTTRSRVNALIGQYVNNYVRCQNFEPIVSGLGVIRASGIYHVDRKSGVYELPL